MTAATKTPTPKLAAVCAYCLRVTRLATSSACPIRHGWKAHGGSGGANGQEGSWHSGSCRGLSFPHLGQSSDGLFAAIADCDAWIARAEGKRAELEARPPLPYYKRDHNRKGSPVIDEVMVQPGAMSPPLSTSLSSAVWGQVAGLLADIASGPTAIAIFATRPVLFALANTCCIAQKGRAFQASSPKTFKPGWQRPGFFWLRCATRPARE